jgi:cytochrome P450
VLANTPAANRDPAVYDDPDRLDITQEGPAPMLTFGGGVHYCLGADLARIALTQALRVITRRMPQARRTGPVTWKPIAGISGPTSLRIAFDPGY